MKPCTEQSKKAGASSLAEDFLNRSVYVERRSEMERSGIELAWLKI
ncbi:MAG: hypothetical protein J1F42_15150 [Lachnospiraceae bacterium]|nr:hypothetical protein [Lachnospiraceae bacterium]